MCERHSEFFCLALRPSDFRSEVGAEHYYVIVRGAYFTSNKHRPRYSYWMGADVYSKAKPVVHDERNRETTLWADSRLPKPPF